MSGSSGPRTWSTVFDDGDARPESPERLRHLDADRPAAEDQQVPRQLRLPRRTVSFVQCGLPSALRRREGGGRAGGDDPRTRGQARPAEGRPYGRRRSRGIRTGLPRRACRNRSGESCSWIVSTTERNPPHDGGEGDRREAPRPEARTPSRRRARDHTPAVRISVFEGTQPKVKAVAAEFSSAFSTRIVFAPNCAAPPPPSAPPAPLQNPKIVLRTPHERPLSDSARPLSRSGREIPYNRRPLSSREGSPAIPLLRALYRVPAELVPHRGKELCPQGRLLAGPESGFAEPT